VGDEPIDLREKFREAGFEIIESSGRPDAFTVKKGNCTLGLQRDANRAWRPVGPPTLEIRGLGCRLEDHGYQKFWLHGDQRFPVRVSDLKRLYQFDREVRSLLGIPALYHESLGTCSARTAYDRLAGRPDR